ncbi:hypothetical protein [Slackia isoflavoniconvertens]|uniref:hypothetical protein n=1 Tax=Slackia isoflavoniconvertens TaxID=572010 RepID=UPI003AF135EC
MRGERRYCDSWQFMRAMSPASKQATTTAFACNVPLAARYGLAAWRAVHCGREW